MQTFFEVLVTGLIATFSMTGVLALLHGPSMTTSDMIRALGSVFTRNISKTFQVGLFAHLLIGTLSAFIYVSIWSIFNFSGLRDYALVGSIVGFAHGLFVSFLLIVKVAEYNPVGRFRRVGFGVALAFLGAHVIYGLTVGLGVGAFDSRFQSMERFAKAIIDRPLGL